MTTDIVKIEEKFNKTNNSNKDLLEAIDLVRLNVDLSIINEEIEKNKQVHATEDSNFFEKVTLGVVNEFKGSKLEKFEKQQKETLARISELSNQSLTYKDVVEMINKTFENDENSMARYLFSVTLIAEQKEYIYNQESEDAVSLMLWGNSTFLGQIKIAFKETYLKIGNAGLTNNQKFVLGASAAALLVTSVALAPILIAASTAITVGAIALPFGFSAITAACVFGSGLTLGTTYAGMKVFNKEQVKNDFKGLNYEEVTYVLALKSMLLEYGHKSMDEENFKEYLNDVLLLTSDLKADSLYYALVEKDNIERNEKLTEAFYRFDKEMLKKYR